eukprot:Clim_evm39s241 gene=Clim_evmTU39s241
MAALLRRSQSLREERLKRSAISGSVPSAKPLLRSSAVWPDQVGPKIQPFVQTGLPWHHPYELTKAIVLSPLALLRMGATLITVIALYLLVLIPVNIGLNRTLEDGLRTVNPPILAPWRRKLLEVAAPFFARVLLFCLGYHHITVTGRLHPDASLLVCNHISFLDPFLIATRVPVCFVAEASNLGLPIAGEYMRITRGIPVNRFDPASRHKVQAAIDSRARGKAGEDFPLLIFPEGTTKSGNTLINFKAGSFRSGAPVQPIVVQYPSRNFDPAWCTQGDGLFPIIFRHYFQLYNSATIEFLPLYRPSREEKINANLYASKVRVAMAEALQERHVTVTDHWIDEARLLGMAIRAGLKDVGVMAQDVAECSDIRHALYKLFKQFTQADQNHSGTITAPEFAKMIDLPQGVATTLFDLIDANHDGTVEFREFILGLKAMQDQIKSRADDPHEQAKFLLRLYDVSGDHQLDRKELEQAFRLARPQEQIQVTRDEIDCIFKVYDLDQNGELDLEEITALLTECNDLYGDILPALLNHSLRMARS